MKKLLLQLTDKISANSNFKGGPIFGGLTKRNILTKHGSGIQFNYHRGNINLGYELTGETLDEDAASSIKTLDSLLGQKKYQQILKLNRGEMLVHNNHFILHGRKSFEDGANEESKRLLIRLWGNQRL